MISVNTLQQLERCCWSCSSYSTINSITLEVKKYYTTCINRSCQQNMYPTDAFDVCFMRSLHLERCSKKWSCGTKDRQRIPLPPTGTEISAGSFQYRYPYSKRMVAHRAWYNMIQSRRFWTFSNRWSGRNDRFFFANRPTEVARWKRYILYFVLPLRCFMFTGTLI